MTDFTPHPVVGCKWCDKRTDGRACGFHKRGTVAQRLEAQRNVTETGCWEWTGGVNASGYGEMGIGKHGRSLTHRAGYEAFVGPIPDGMCVLHRCDNPPCFNPDHLFLGTRQENNLDMVAKGRHWLQGRTHCANGHEYTPENTRFRPDKRYCRACERIRSQQRRRAA